VVTDVDGCLLDHRTYRAGPARRVLRRLRRLGVPVVLCTSKTRVELRALRRELDGPHLAIVEDGAGILVPAEIARALRLPAARRVRDGRLVPLAPAYGTIRRVFAALRRATGGAVVGFGDLTVAGVAAATGLPLSAARRARRREFDEPFLFVSDERLHARRVPRYAARHGLVVTRGGRFWHLHGPTDKGRATRIARELLQRAHGALFIIALGDSPLDAPMLREADMPIIVPRPDGSADPALRRRLPRARVAPAPGPAGWAQAVTRAVRELRHSLGRTTARVPRYLSSPAAGARNRATRSRAARASS
jgi:mannosyl-3-phosphoglycerate phosphatase family protein